MVGVEHVGGVEPQLTFSKSESELLKMMRAVKVVTDHFHPWLMNEGWEPFFGQSNGTYERMKKIAIPSLQG